VSYTHEINLFIYLHKVKYVAILRRREDKTSTKVRLPVLCKLKTSAWFLDICYDYHYTTLKE